MSHKTFVWLCLLPLTVVTVAFFLLPMARLVVTGAVFSFMTGVIHPYYMNVLAPAIAVLVGVGAVVGDPR